MTSIPAIISEQLDDVQRAAIARGDAKALNALARVKAEQRQKYHAARDREIETTGRQAQAFADAGGFRSSSKRTTPAPALSRFDSSWRARGQVRQDPGAIPTVPASADPYGVFGKGAQ